GTLVGEHWSEICAPLALAPTIATFWIVKSRSTPPAVAKTLIVAGPAAVPDDKVTTANPCVSGLSTADAVCPITPMQPGRSLVQGKSSAEDSVPIVEPPSCWCSKRTSSPSG